MEGAAIGVLGVIIGVLLSEIIRRRNRIEAYAREVFTERLHAHQGLFDLVSGLGPIAKDVMENRDYTDDERLDIVSRAIQGIAGFCDKNAFYIERRLALHCIAVMMGVEDICRMESESDRERESSGFWHNLNLAKQMIRDDSGITEIERHFHGVNRPELKSDVISHYEKLERQ